MVNMIKFFIVISRCFLIQSLFPGSIARSQCSMLWAVIRGPDWIEPCIINVTDSSYAGITLSIGT